MLTDGAVWVPVPFPMLIVLDACGGGHMRRAAVCHQAADQEKEGLRLGRAIGQNGFPRCLWLGLVVIMVGDGTGHSNEHGHCFGAAGHLDGTLALQCNQHPASGCPPSSARPWGQSASQGFCGGCRGFTPAIPSLSSNPVFVQGMNRLCMAFESMGGIAMPQFDDECHCVCMFIQHHGRFG